LTKSNLQSALWGGGPKRGHESCRNGRRGCSAECSDARVGRTLPSASSGQALSVAFDFDVDLDTEPDREGHISRPIPSLQRLVILSGARRGAKRIGTRSRRTPALLAPATDAPGSSHAAAVALDFDFDVDFDREGHGFIVPKNVWTLKDREGHEFHSCRSATSKHNGFCRPIPTPQQLVFLSEACRGAKRIGTRSRRTPALLAHATDAPGSSHAAAVAFDFDFDVDFDRKGHGFQPCRKAPDELNPASAATAQLLAESSSPGRTARQGSVLISLVLFFVAFASPSRPLRSKASVSEIRRLLRQGWVPTDRIGCFYPKLL